MERFEIKEDFVINSNKIKIISGAIHYFRVVPEYWRDRLEKLKALGCNVVETYIPWNFHEEKEGQFNFEGDRDVVKFIRTAEELGLYVILRPSPYICAEWDFGGLPAWLLKDNNVRVRSNDNIYLNAIDKYYAELFKLLTPLQITKKGPIIMMQIENEFGSFSNNKEYLKNVRDIMLKYGVEVPLFTSDGGWNDMLQSGGLIEEGVLPTANFGGGTKEQMKNLKDFMSENKFVGPLMCMEFWIGWFDSWGNDHKTRDKESASEELKSILELGSVNIYMFHGGTNFRFFNGANYDKELQPQTTSYDYDALLTEAGEFTPKYYAFKEVISKYIDIPEVNLSTNIKKINYGEVKLKNKVSLFSTLDTLAKPIAYENTLPMEKLGQGYGYLLYKSKLGKKKNLENIQLIGMDDRAQIFVNNKLVGTRCKDAYLGENIILEKKEYEELLQEKDNSLDILVENMGRVNYGAMILAESQKKGIKGGVMVDHHFHHNWEHYSLEFDNIERIDFSLEYKENTPAFYEYEFNIEECGDTFFSTEGFGKGCAFINNFNLGRFWEVGPTNQLYIPAPLLKKGKNKIVIFETEGKYKECINFLI